MMSKESPLSFVIPRSWRTLNQTLQEEWVGVGGGG